MLIIGPNPFFHSPTQTTAHSPELIFHIMKSRDQTSVLLSVAIGSIQCRKVQESHLLKIGVEFQPQKRFCLLLRYRIRRSPNPHPSLQGEINGEAALRSLPSSRIRLVRYLLRQFNPKPFLSFSSIPEL